MVREILVEAKAHKSDVTKRAADQVRDEHGNVANKNITHHLFGSSRTSYDWKRNRVKEVASTEDTSNRTHVGVEKHDDALVPCPVARV